MLKGDDTLVADAGRPLRGLARATRPALATAGTGDVLSGVVAAMLAKRMAPLDAVCAGVHVHARAGRLAASRTGRTA